MAQDRKDGKLFIFGDDARKYLFEGSETVYKAVSLTYGPKGLNAAIEKSYGRPMITRDGVTVARESYLEERAPNLGAQMVIEASQTTNSNAGDGTSATVALTHNLLKLGHQRIAAGFNPMDVKQEIMDDSYKILDNLATMSKPVKKGQLIQVASVSCGDEALGQLIAEAVEYVGADGGLVTEKAPIAEVDRSYVNGYFLQQGFSAITQGKKEVTNPYIIVTSKPITAPLDIVKLVNKVGELAHIEQNIPIQEQLREPISISFFGEIDGDAYNMVVNNIKNATFDGSITKTPPSGMGEQYLDDLAIYTGGKIISAGERLSDVDASFIGRAEKVTCTTAETTVFGGQYKEEDFNKRKADLKDRIKTEALDAVVEKVKDRLAKLENKIAVFRIGGATETEREEKEFRIEDAIQATRAAAGHGVVTGGGITLLKLSKTKGVGIVFENALQNVFKKLMENANQPTDVRLNQALTATEGYGFNLRKDGNKLVNLVSEGILDPTLVVEEIVKNAASTAGNMVTIGMLQTFIDKEEK